MNIIVCYKYEEVTSKFDKNDLTFIGAFDNDCPSGSLLMSLSLASCGYSSLVVTLSPTNNKRYIVYGLR